MQSNFSIKPQKKGEMIHKTREFIKKKKINKSYKQNKNISLQFRQIFKHDYANAMTLYQCDLIPRFNCILLYSFFSARSQFTWTRNNITSNTFQFQFADKHKKNEYIFFFF